MTADYRKLSRAVTLTAAAAPDVVSFLTQINTSPDAHYTAANLAKAFCLTPFHEKQYAFGWQSQQYTFTMIPQGNTNSPVLSLTQNTSLAHSTDDVMLLGQMSRR